MTEMDKMKKQLDLNRMKFAIQENEFKIFERHEDIKKIEKTILDQMKVVEKLENELNK